MYRHPPRRHASTIRAAIRASEQIIARYEAEGHDTFNERHYLRLVLLPELQRSEKRERVVA